MATGTVRWLSVRVNVRANRNSFHAAMKANKPVVTRAGQSSGNSTRVSVTQGDAPSMIAASSSSWGSCPMNVVSTQTVKGRVKIV
ncbi:hypothetical protein D3C85_1580870 [compost metagenome]